VKTNQKKANLLWLLVARQHRRVKKKHMFLFQKKKS